MATRNHLAEAKQSYENGATRSEKLERYDLIPAEAEKALADRFGLGAIKHGESNWKGGGKDFIKGCINHLGGHLYSLKINGLEHDDDDIGAMLWNVAALAWFRANKPEDFRAALQDLK